ncbi:MAG: Bax inhibitor-1/YccA family protein [Rhizobiaceae bacterium]
MSDFRTNPMQNQASAGVVIDEGLRAYMLRVYNLMMLGLAITGAVAWGVSTYAMSNEAAFTFLYLSPFRWVMILAPLALVFFLGFRINSMSVSAAQTTFWVYAGLVGASLSTIFFVYTQASIVQTFFITAAAFGALSLYGYTTRRDLSGMGTFMVMGLFGLIIASLVNLFLRSPGLEWALSIIGVIVFSGLTAWDTQKIKEMYFEGDDEATGGRKAIMGALNLYLDFINLFMFLLRFMGNRE